MQNYAKITNYLSNKMIKSILEVMDGFKEIKILNFEKNNPSFLNDSISNFDCGIRSII